MSVARTNYWLRVALAVFTASLFALTSYWLWTAQLSRWLALGAIVALLAIVVVGAAIAVRAVGARYFRNLS